MEVCTEEFNPGRLTKWRPNHIVYDSGFSEPLTELIEKEYMWSARVAKESTEIISQMLKGRRNGNTH